MKLFVKTDLDLENTGWLKYIIDEFRRIQKANFDIILVHRDKKIPKSYPYIYYLGPENIKRENRGLVIPNFSGKLPNGYTRFIRERIFVLEGTYVDSRDLMFEYDVFWNSFVFLSRLEEYISDIKGKQNRSYSMRHIRKDKSTFYIPVVNYIFGEIEEKLKRFGLSFDENSNFYIEFSHDVDYIRKTFQLVLKSEFFNLYNILKGVKKPRSILPKVLKALKFPFTRRDYFLFDFWVELEEKFGKKSTFYVYVKSNPGKKNYREHLISFFIDPSYNLIEDSRLRAKLRDLLSAGFGVGLHGSFFSAMNFDIAKREKEILEEILGSDVKKVRQHWLNYDSTITPYIHEKLFEFDSTLGWNDMIGFRSGIASMHRGFDHKSGRPFKYFEIPLVAMDSTIFDYNFPFSEEYAEKLLSLLNELKKIKNVYISLLWHQQTCSDDYGWEKLYEKIISLF